MVNVERVQRTSAVVSPRVAVVIVHWNQPERCRRTLECFAAQTAPADVLVVDNASGPEAFDDLRGHLGDIPLRSLSHNAGFGPAANVGLRHWLDSNEYELVVVAPHDALPEPDCLERMIDAMSSGSRRGLACADVGDGYIPTMDPYLGSMPVPASVEEGWESADYAHGTLLMARCACLREVGLFDERYFAYGEEIDLGLRAKAAGWEVGLVRGARVHNPSMRSGPAAVEYLYSRNAMLLVYEHSGRYHAFIRFLFAVAGIFTGLMRPAWRAPMFEPRARIRGLLDYLRGRYGPPPADYFQRFDRRGEPVSDSSTA